MKKRSIALFAALIFTVAGVLSACTKSGDRNQGNSSATEAVTQAPVTNDTVTQAPSGSDQGDKSGEQTTASPSGDDNSSADNTSSAEGLTVTTEVSDGWSEKKGVYTITKAGEYTFSGNLAEGRIVVDAKEQEVSVILSGVTLSSVEDSVIYVENAEEVTIVAQNGTVNSLSDNRPQKIGNTELAGNACIYSKDDLSIQGKGTLIVNASYNKGIHSKNDLKIKNLTLEVTAVGTALQGNDSVTIKSGNITLVSTGNDGIKTKDTDISPKGKQRGIVSIEEGTVSITAKDECINAAYDVQIGASATVTQNKYEK